jgi:hypothetical protein
VALRERDMVWVPTPNGVPHLGVVIELDESGDALVALVARGTGSSHRDPPCECVEMDDDRYSDAREMGLSKTTYFYADEFVPFPVGRLKAHPKHRCPVDVWNRLRELDAEWKAALAQADLESGGV